MAFKQNLGRFFLAMVFILPGIWKILHPSAYQISMIANIMKLMTLITDYTGYSLPIEANFFSHNAVYLVYALASAQILSSLLVISNCRYGIPVLMLTVIYLSATINNPWNYAKREDKVINSMMCFLNLAVMASLMVFCNREKKVKND